MDNHLEQSIVHNVKLSNICFITVNHFNSYPKFFSDSKMFEKYENRDRAIKQKIL